MIPSRWNFAVIAVFAGLLAWLVLGSFHFVRSRRSAEEAATNLAACRQLAQQIAVLRTTPSHASLQTRGRQDLTLAIQHAAQLAEIPDSAIVRVTPQAGRRVGKSTYIEQPTTVEIQQVTLGQLVRLARELSTCEQALTATSLRVTAPRNPPEPATTETWSVEVVLTHLVFSPEYAPSQFPASSQLGVRP